MDVYIDFSYRKSGGYELVICMDGICQHFFAGKAELAATMVKLSIQNKKELKSIYLDTNGVGRLLADKLTEIGVNYCELKYVRMNL